MTNEILKRLDAQDFKKSVLGEFTPKNPAETGHSQVSNLMMWSYAPNAISALSAIFFVWYLIASYSIIVKVLLGAILGFAVIANEIAKRKLITAQSKRYLQTKKVGASILFLLICIAASVYTSYKGGNEVVIQNAKAPTLPSHPDIIELQEKLTALNDDIAKQKSTTWKGRITVDANRNLKTLYNTQEILSNRLLALQATQDKKQAASDKQHNTTTLSGGVTLGAICIAADLVLIILLTSIWKIRYNVYRLETAGKSRTAGFNLSTNVSTPSFSENLAGSSRTVVKGFQKDVFNVNNGDVSDLELKAMITGHKTRAASYKQRKTAESQQKAAYHKRRAEELEAIQVERA